MTADYSEHYVAFLDILGFKSIVDSADKIYRGIEVDKGDQSAAYLIQEVNYTLESVFHNVKSTRLGERLAIKVFSDCLSISVAQDEEGLAMILDAAAYIQQRFTWATAEGIFLRGGLSRGGHFENERIMFSAGLVAASELEKKASYPRVVVDDAVVADLQCMRNSKWHSKAARLVMCAPDGVRFVDYLETVNPCSFGELGCECLGDHKLRIVRQGKANRDNPAVLGKYLWVASYHNSKCADFASMADIDADSRRRLTDECMIDIPTELSGFTRLSSGA